MKGCPVGEKIPDAVRAAILSADQAAAEARRLAQEQADRAAQARATDTSNASTAMRRPRLVAMVSMICVRFAIRALARGA
mgnify:CR=1 FL=1